MRSRQHEQPKATNDGYKNWRRLKQFDAAVDAASMCPCGQYTAQFVFAEKGTQFQIFNDFVCMLLKAFFAVLSIACVRCHTWRNLPGLSPEFEYVQSVWRREDDTKHRWRCKLWSILLRACVAHIRNSFEKSWKRIPAGPSDLAFIYYIIETEKWRYQLWLIRSAANRRITSFLAIHRLTIFSQLDSSSNEWYF